MAWFRNVTIDCPDPARLAPFWEAALGYEQSVDSNDQYLALTPPGGGFPRVLFQRVPESKTVKNRVHLDLASDDRPVEVRRLLGLGARKLADFDGEGFTLLADPEDNEFCVVDP